MSDVVTFDPMLVAAIQQSMPADIQFQHVAPKYPG